MGKRIPFLLGLIVVIIAVLVQISDVKVIQVWKNRLENVAYDMQMRTKLITQRNVPFKTSVVIADIDDKSIKKEGHWPWSRIKLAALTDHLRKAGAVVIAYDMIFPEQEDNIATLVADDLTKNKLMSPQVQSVFQQIIPSFDSDTIFAKSLAQGDSLAGIVLLPTPQVEGSIPAPLLKLTPEENQLNFITSKGVIGPNPVLANYLKNYGFVNSFQDEDGVIRKIPLLIRFQGGLYPSLALEAVRIYLLTNIKLDTAFYGKMKRLEGIEMGNILIPTDAESRIIIPFRGPSFTFPYYSATDILKNKIPDDAFTGKIVFVGSTGLGDLRATAIQSVFPGTEINATIADGILKNDFPVKPTWAPGAEVIITVIIGIICVFIFPFFGPLSSTICILLIPPALIFLNSWFSEKTGLILSVFMPIILIIFIALMNMSYGYLFETRQRIRLKGIFGQYVPETHIDEMLKSSGNYGLLGEDREMTVLFADIRSFTTLSEHMSATNVKEMLNEFFTAMTKIIFNYHGTIDKYIGDLIMAFWGAPLKDTQHTENAINATLDMQKEVIRIRPILKEHHWPELNIGIGLNSGIMSVGDMGSQFRRNYTVLGDAVNLASRVESLTKYYDAKIIVTENTRKGQDKFVFRLLDRVRVKGKEIGVELYEVICRKAELTDVLEKELTLHHEAMQGYFNVDWQKAHELFSQLLKQYPDKSRLYTMYLGRIEHYMQTPPPADWGGIYEHKEK